MQLAKKIGEMNESNYTYMKNVDITHQIFFKKFVSRLGQA